MRYFDQIIPFAAAMGVCAFLSLTNPVFQQSGKQRPGPYPVIPQKDFLHVWTGWENCNNHGGRLSFAVTLTALDSTGVYISGLFKPNDSIKGKIRGYIIVIAKQQVSTMPKGTTIEGSLSLSNDRQTLKGFFTTHIEGRTDSCTAGYHYKTQ